VKKLHIFQFEKRARFTFRPVLRYSKVVHSRSEQVGVSLSRLSISSFFKNGESRRHGCRYLYVCLHFFLFYQQTYYQLHTIQTSRGRDVDSPDFCSWIIFPRVICTKTTYFLRHLLIHLLSLLICLFGACSPLAACSCFESTPAFGPSSVFVKMFSAVRDEKGLCPIPRPAYDARRLGC